MGQDDHDQGVPMDWYDTAGDSWLDTAFGDVNVDGYHDVVPADDLSWLGDPLSVTDLVPPVPGDPADDPAAPWPATPAAEADPFSCTTPDDALGSAVWTLPRPW
jgi:hypothetical protein